MCYIIHHYYVIIIIIFAVVVGPLAKGKQEKKTPGATPVSQNIC